MTEVFGAVRGIEGMTNLLFRMFLVAGESLNFTLLFLYALSGLGRKDT